MSLERTALRMAVVMALSNAYQAPFPTIAANRVFDSRIDPIEGLSPGDMLPIVVVYTDEADSASLSTNNGGPPWRTTVSLIFELSIGLVGDLRDETGARLTDADGKPLPGDMIPIATEPELEAMLDLFEDQIHRIFRVQPTPWGRRLFDKHIVRVESWESRRFVEREGQTRLAARQIVARVMLPQPEDLAIVPEAPESVTIPEPLGSLLQAIVAGAGPYAEDAANLAETLQTHGGFAPLVLPPLERVRFKEADLGGGNLAGDGPARPDGLAQAVIPQT